MACTTFREYLSQNAEAIRNNQQLPYRWNDGLKEGSIRAINQAKENHDFNAVDVPETLNRDNVSTEWKKGLYNGFVSTLLWGGYHIPVFTRRNLPAVAAIPRTEVEEKLSRVKSLLERGNFAEAFESMLPGKENHIYGIGVSFFTKFMYFITRDMLYASGVQPLIFDNQSRKMHICLLKDSGEEVSKWYNRKLTHARGRTDVELYMDYIDRMAWYASDVDATGEQLEAFLFGVPLRGTEGKAMTNPRAVISHIAKEVLR